MNCNSVERQMYVVQRKILVYEKKMWYDFLRTCHGRVHSGESSQERSAEGVAVIKGFIAAYLSGKRTEHTTIYACSTL